MFRNTALLGLRAVLGGYLAAHGAQKLFGVLGGHGLEGTGSGFEALGLTPGREMAAVAGSTELGSGVLIATGLGGPIGPIAAASTMAVAAGTAHRGKGPFAMTGGPELALTNLAAAGVLAAVGPGAFSFDRLLRTRPSRLAVLLSVVGGAVGAALLVQRSIEAERAKASAEPEQQTLPINVRGDDRDDRAESAQRPTADDIQSGLSASV
jgi:putative oxidoreductase